jgi:hypothetical protein
LLDITEWWLQQDETHRKYFNLSNVARNIISLIPDGVGVEACYSFRCYVCGWRQSKSTGETLRNMVIVWQFTGANIRLLAGAEPELDPTSADNNLEMK